jgi:hypothetical protein
MKQLFTLSFLLIISINLFAQNVGIGNTNPQAALDLQGDVRLRSAVLTLPAGLNDNVDLVATKSSVYMFAGASLTGCQITGFAGGIDGRMITIFNNSTTNSVHLYDESNALTQSAYFNKILTGTGNTAVINQNGSVTLRYDGAKLKWIIVSSNYTNGLTNEFWKLNGIQGNELKNINTGGIWSENNVGLDELSDNVTNPPTAPTTGAGTRMMWIPSRSAFRVGTVQNTPQFGGSVSWNQNNIGLFSFASGFSSLASGKHSIAMGHTAIVSGISSVAIGTSLGVNGDYAVAMGKSNYAAGLNSTAFGNNTRANGAYSTAMGLSTLASGNTSTAIGDNTTASAINSTAMGKNTTASGPYSTAIGYNTLASGGTATVFGENTIASGLNSTAIGYNTTASGTNSTAIGNLTFAIGSSSTAMGYGTRANTVASTAMGYQTIAIGNYSTAMGYQSQSYGAASTSLGFESSSAGNYSTAMGYRATASGAASTSMGFETNAEENYSTAIGIFNNGNVNALFMVGNGTTNANRYNTFTIRKDNNCVGINNDNPQAALHVSGYQNVSGGQASFFYPVSQSYYLLEQNLGGYITARCLNYSPSFTASLGILSDYGIMSKTYVGSGVNIVSSDSRIKNIIGISNSKEDLDRLKKIEITNYKMKDVNTWGNQVFKKVIAQQVEEVYPEVIKKTKSTIPDIYALAQTVAYNEKNKELTITLSKSYNIKIGDKIELVHPKNGKQVAEVIAVMDNSFTIKDWAHATDKIFVFGREVNDFRNVDYEALSMLGISAIQQLAIEVEDLKKENKKIATNFESRLNALELMLKPTIVVNK